MYVLSGRIVSAVRIPCAYESSFLKEMEIFSNCSSLGTLALVRIYTPVFLSTTYAPATSPRRTASVASVRDRVCSSHETKSRFLPRVSVTTSINFMQFSIPCKKSRLAGPPGVEPGTFVLETKILPLNYRPVCAEYQIEGQWKSRHEPVEWLYDMNMRSRVSLFALILIVGSAVLPLVAHAGGIPFFGPIIEKGWSQCPLGWGALITVINNIISLLLTLAIVFVAPLMIAYSGFLLVVSQGNSGKRTEARKILTNTVVGIVLALAGWMIVAAIMAALYNPETPIAGGKLGLWSDLIGSRGIPPCIDLKGSLKPAVTPPPTVVPSVPG